ESPWTKYEEVFDVELGELVKVAIQNAPTTKLVSVRVFPAPAAEKTLHMYRRVQHQNIVAALDAFTTDDGLYVVLEHMPLTLEWIVRSPAYPNERQLAAILGQILDGVAYLAAEGLEHGSLSCSDILINTDGDVKIANQHACRLKPQQSVGDLRALSSITMELMQKYVKEDGAIGIDNLHRWHSNSDAVSFLSATTSVESAAELRKHPLLSRPWRKESLIGLVSLAQICARGRYSYSQRVQAAR
ncbi:kinase-like domain-containing protein, partial [Dendryphion nanum]